MHVNKKARQSEQMRARLIASARELFEQNGFDGVSAEEVVAAAGVTRGALYHHFGGKEGLFVAVAEAAMEKLHRQIVADTEGSTKPRDSLAAAIDAFLVRTNDREIQQLLFVDAPLVMGWSEWRACDEKYGLGALMDLIQSGTKEGEFQTKQPKVSAQILLSAMIEGALIVAAHPTDQGVRATVENNLKNWIATI